MTTSDRQRVGLTLIELMTLLVILTIIGAIALPQIGRHDDLKVASAARQLVADFYFAQSRAVARGRPVFVTFDVAAGKYAVLDSFSPPTPVAEIDARSFTQTRLEGVTIASAQFNDSRILAFGPAGEPLACDGAGAPAAALENGVITLHCGDVTETITIHPITGEITVQGP